ncbi:MAG TPA: hypothetical protein VNB06_04315, partial [Thermoanaerobaculia bacterium]|nr:hypothetical protein [Thermoanaerobaculia bacterium]
TFRRQLTRAGGHMDVTRDTSGEEVLVWTNSADPSPICDNGIVKVRLSDSQQSCLLSLDWSLAVHISCPDGNGSCFVGTYAPSDPTPERGWPAFTNELLQVLLDGSEVRRLAHHRSRPFNGYNYMARATVSRDGGQLVFNSNYGLQSVLGAPSEYSDAYLIAVTPAAGSGGGTGEGGGAGGGGGTAGSGARHEEDSPAIAYSDAWFPNTATAHSGGGAALAMDPGQRARFAFEGTGVLWLGYRDEWSGIARVYLDGSLAATLDTYVPSAQAQSVLFAVDGLAAAPHVLEIEVTGQIGPASSGAWIWIDAFDVVGSSSGSGSPSGDSEDPVSPDGTDSSTGWLEEDASAVELRGGWRSDAAATHSGGTAAQAKDRGSRATVRFTGTAVRWIGTRDAWSGVAKVRLDGVVVKRVNTYSPSARAQQTLFSVDGLADGPHTLEIEVLGYGAKKSKGTWIWVDAFEVR